MTKKKLPPTVSGKLGEIYQRNVCSYACVTQQLVALAAEISVGVAIPSKLPPKPAVGTNFHNPPPKREKTPRAKYNTAETGAPSQGETQLLVPRATPYANRMTRGPRALGHPNSKNGRTERKCQ